MIKKGITTKITTYNPDTNNTNTPYNCKIAGEAITGRIIAKAVC